MPSSHRHQRPPIPSDSPLLSLLPQEKIDYVPIGVGGVYMMFDKGLYGSLAVSLPLVGGIVTGLILTIDRLDHDPSPYGPHDNWLVISLGVLLLLHIVGLVASVIRLRRDPRDPRALVRALRRAPWLLWFSSALLLARYPWQPVRVTWIVAIVPAVLALLTHLAVWASLRNRRLTPR